MYIVSEKKNSVLYSLISQHKYALRYETFRNTLYVHINRFRVTSIKSNVIIVEASFDDLDNRHF